MMKPLHVVLACILVDMIGVGLVIPTLPQISESLGGTTALYGWVGTAYGIGQLIGGPFCGYLSDRLGRKTILILSFCGSCLSYGLMVVAWDFKVLLFCRLIIGLVKQTMTVGTALVSDMTSDSERTRAMGFVSTASGIGFIVGPIVGGLLSKYSIRLPLLIATCFFAINIVVAFKWMVDPNAAKHSDTIIIAAPSSAAGGTIHKRGSSSSSTGGAPVASAAPSSFFPPVTVINDASSSSSSSPAATPVIPTSANKTTKIRRKKKMTTAALLRLPYETVRAMSILLGEVQAAPALLRVLLVQALSSAALLMIQSVMLLHMKDTFELTARGNGMVLGYIGILGVAINWIGLQRIITALGGEDNTIVFCFVVGGAGCLLGGFTASLLYFMICVTGISIGINLSRTVLVSMYTRLAPANKCGSYLGLADSLAAIARVVMPFAGAEMMAITKPLPWIAAAVTQFVMILYWMRTHGHAIAAAKQAATAPHPVPAGADPTLCPFLSSSAPAADSSSGDDDNMMSNDEYETVEVPTDTIIVGTPTHANAKLAAQSSFVAGASGAAPVDEDAAIAAAVAAAEAAIDSFVNQLAAKDAATIRDNTYDMNNLTHDTTDTNTSNSNTNSSSNGTHAHED